MSQYLRHTGRLPLTALIVRECPAFDGTPGFIVREFGYSKEEFWQACECRPYEPSPDMADQLNQWQRMIGVL